MSDETTVQNGAAMTGEPKGNSTRALTGKIARLPKNIREELNRRLDNGETGPVILPWVNGLPAVKKILDGEFGGVPINDGNLFSWRHNGYERWLKKQESVAELKELAEDAKDYSDATGGTLARGTASIAAAKILKMLQAIPATADSLEALTKISYAVTALMNAEQAQVRLEYEKTRVFQGNERLVLSWDKFLRSRVETAQRALEDAICKDIQAANIDNGEKIELLGYELFGKKWQGRVVGKKEEPKKEPESSKKDSGEGEKAEKVDAQQRVPTETRGTKAVEPQPSAVKNEPKEKIQETPPNQETPKDSKQKSPEKIEPKKTDAPFVPVGNPKPKPQEDPLAPKPSPWDAFSEPVKPSPFASLHGLLRPPPGFNTLG
jgi:hypothetical protein